MQWFVCGKDVKVIEMIFSLKFCLQFYGNLNYLAQKYPTSIQFLLHVRDVVKTQNLKVGQNVPQNLVKISGHPPPMIMLSRRPWCNYLDDNQIITNQQSGFRKKHSTETSLLAATDRWYCNMDNGLLNGVLFLDLKKAFDCVDHQILLNKLALYGIRGITLNWFKSYLSKRKQICKVNNIFSDVKPIKTGVPQGSNLGPLLFLTYVNDLPNCLDSASASMFADDTNITITGQTVQEL